VFFLLRENERGELDRCWGQRGLGMAPLDGKQEQHAGKGFAVHAVNIAKKVGIFFRRTAVKKNIFWSFFHFMLTIYTGQTK